jgi:ribosomal protein S18 acetylase RimI-like enzyme
MHPGDELFLFELYASTRSEEIAACGWTDAAGQAFLRQQFTAQQRSYAAAYPDADDRIVLIDAQPSGRLIVQRGAEAIRIVDIALLPGARNRGVGGRLVGDMMTEAAESRRAILLQVLRTNRAIRFYERLGFSHAGGDAVRLQMKWHPPGP